MVKKNFKRWAVGVISGLALATIAACSDGAAPNEPEMKKKDAEPEAEQVTIKWAYQSGEELFEENIGQYLKDAFPNVKIEVQLAGTDHPDTIEQIVAAGNSPDIVTMQNLTHTSHMAKYELAYDMTELIEETGFDLERFEPSFIEFAKNQDPLQEKGLVVIPTTRPTYSLHYNKDVFDVLGVDYPKDGMTWEEVTDLAKKLTREVNGVQYRGFDLDTPYDAYTQFSQSSIDPETNEVKITESEAFRRYLELIGEMTSIPGNYPTEKPGDLLHNWGEEFAKGNVAMTAVNTNHGWLEKDNIDIATYPVWEGYEGIAPQPRGEGYAITEPSEHKEVALALIDHLLSEEVQMAKSKKGVASPLASPKVHEVYLEEKPEIKEKHLESLFIDSYATGLSKRSLYGDGVITTAGIEYVNSGKDINEFLRILQEQAEENVREQMASE